MAKSKTRLSINGWFHGPINHRPSPVAEATPTLTTLGPIDV